MTGKNLSISFGGSNVESVRLTDNCAEGLSDWTKPDRDADADETARTFDHATSQAEQDCVKEWRTY